MAGAEFSFDYTPWLRPFLLLIGARPTNSGVELGAEELVVRMGIGFRARIPRGAIRAARRTRDAWWAIGVHTNLSHSWLVNASPHGIVSLDLDPLMPARCLGFPVRVKRLGLGLRDPEGFLRALGVPTT